MQTGRLVNEYQEAPKNKKKRGKTSQTWDHSEPREGEGAWGRGSLGGQSGNAFVRGEERG